MIFISTVKIFVIWSKETYQGYLISSFWQWIWCWISCSWISSRISSSWIETIFYLWILLHIIRTFNITWEVNLPRYLRNFLFSRIAKWTYQKTITMGPWRTTMSSIICSVNFFSANSMSENWILKRLFWPMTLPL